MKKLEERILLLLKVAGDNGCTTLDMVDILNLWLGSHWPALATLEKEGRVRSEWLPLEPNRLHRRRIYFLPWCGRPAEKRALTQDE